MPESWNAVRGLAARMTMPLPMQQQQAVHQGPRAPRPATCALLWQTGQLPCRSYPTWALSCTMAQWLWLAASKMVRECTSGQILGTWKVREVRMSAQPMFWPCSGSSPMLISILGLEAGPQPALQITSSLCFLLFLLCIVRDICSLQERKAAGAGGVESYLITHPLGP